MSEEKKNELEDELRPEYDLAKLKRVDEDKLPEHRKKVLGIKKISLANYQPDAAAMAAFSAQVAEDLKQNR